VDNQADVGFAQDADADRLAVIDGDGRPIGEEYTLALATMFILERRKGAVVINLSTTQAIDEIAAKFGCKVIRTKIGEINVVEGMIQYEAVVGGEGNGGVILPGVHYCRDSMAGMGAVLQLMAEQRVALSKIMAKLPRFSMVKTKTEFAPDRISQLESALQRHFTDAQKNTLDGLKLSWEDRWLHVRPSNTEPVIRLVAEARTRRRAQALVREAQKILLSLKN
jgi:phosphomannomutase